MRFRRMIAICLLAVLLLLSACNAPAEAGQTDAPDTSVPTDAPTDMTEPSADDEAASDEWPSYRMDIEPIPLSIDGADDGILEIKDARGDRVLFALHEKLLDPQGMYAYYRTVSLGIYSTSEQTVTTLWTLETVGWYYAGALCAEDSAVFACMTDYSDAHPDAYSLIALGEAQNELCSLEGEYSPMLAAMPDGSVLFSYAQNDGAFGVRAILDGTVSDVLKWQSDGDSVQPLGGELSVCGESFAYPCVQDGQAVLITADLQGETAREPLEYGKEKLDSFSLTQQGLVASLSLNEGSDDAERALTFFRKTGEPLRLARQATDGALYRMAFDNIFGFAVDSLFDLYVLYASGDRIDCHKLTDDELGALAPLNGTTADIFVADDVSFCLYYPEAGQLFRVTLAPAA